MTSKPHHTRYFRCRVSPLVPLAAGHDVGRSHSTVQNRRKIEFHYSSAQDIVFCRCNACEWVGSARASIRLITAAPSCQTHNSVCGRGLEHTNPCKPRLTRAASGGRWGTEFGGCSYTESVVMLEICVGEFVLLCVRSAQNVPWAQRKPQTTRNKPSVLTTNLVSADICNRSVRLQI